MTWSHKHLSVPEFFQRLPIKQMFEEEHLQRLASFLSENAFKNKLKNIELRVISPEEEDAVAGTKSRGMTYLCGSEPPIYIEINRLKCDSPELIYTTLAHQLCHACVFVDRFPEAAAKFEKSRQLEEKELVKTDPFDKSHGKAFMEFVEMFASYDSKALLIDPIQ